MTSNLSNLPMLRIILVLLSFLVWGDGSSPLCMRYSAISRANTKYSQSMLCSNLDGKARITKKKKGYNHANKLPDFLARIVQNHSAFGYLDCLCNEVTANLVGCPVNGCITEEQVSSGNIMAKAFGNIADQLC